MLAVWNATWNTSSPNVIARVPTLSLESEALLLEIFLDLERWRSRLNVPLKIAEVLSWQSPACKSKFAIRDASDCRHLRIIKWQRCYRFSRVWRLWQSRHVETFRPCVQVRNWKIASHSARCWRYENQERKRRININNFVQWLPGWGGALPTGWPGLICWCAVCGIQGT